MTPLEKAEDAGQRLGLFGPDAGGHERSFHSGDAAAIIRAFLEAAVEDVQTVRSADIAFWQAIDGREPPVFRHGAPAKAAILALKETINAS